MRVAYFQKILYAVLAGDEEENVLEDNPRRMFDPAVRTRHADAEDRFGPIDSPKEVVERQKDRGRDQHGPIAIKGEKCQRTEHVKVGFDPSAADVDEQRRKEHLSDCNHVTRDQAAGKRDRQIDRKRRQRTPQSHGKPNMGMNVALRAVPRLGTKDQSGDDSPDPLENHQDGKHPVCAAKDLLSFLLEDATAIRANHGIRFKFHFRAPFRVRKTRSSWSSE